MTGAPEVSAPLWTPTPERVRQANLTRFIAEARPGATYPELWQWSVDHPEAFWPAVWDFCGIRAAARGDSVLQGGARMAPPSSDGPHWFPEARLNFAENLLRFADDHPALIFWNEYGRQRELTYRALQDEVAQWEAALVASGVGVGDRVAGLMPNMPETVIAMLATTALGAIWTSCSPDFGDRAVLDRFGQIHPKVLIVTDGYHYAGKRIELHDRVARIAAALPDASAVVVVPYLATGQLGGSVAPRLEEPIRANDVPWAGAVAGARDAELRSRRAEPRVSVQPSARTSSTRQARRACPRPSSTGRGARCCNCRRNWCCTPISRGTIGSSTSPPAAG